MRYLAIFILCLTSYCGYSQNNAFDSMTPESLKMALDKCPERHPSHVSCAKLKDDAEEMSRLAYRLRIDPLGYGQKIMQLQCSIAQNIEISATNNSSALLSLLVEQKLSLSEHLQIVNWLASPG